MDERKKARRMSLLDIVKKTVQKPSFADVLQKGILKISQYTQENTCAKVSFRPRARPATLLKKRLWCRCFRVNFEKFLRTTFFTEHLLLPVLQTNPTIGHRRSI